MGRESPTEADVLRFEIQQLASGGADVAEHLAKTSAQIAEDLRAGRIPSGAGLNGFEVLELSRRLGRLQALDDALTRACQPTKGAP